MTSIHSCKIFHHSADAYFFERYLLCHELTFWNFLASFHVSFIFFWHFLSNLRHLRLVDFFVFNLFPFSLDVRHRRKLRNFCFDEFFCFRFYSWFYTFLNAHWNRTSRVIISMITMMGDNWSELKQIVPMKRNNEVT